MAAFFIYNFYIPILLRRKKFITVLSWEHKPLWFLKLIKKIYF